MKAPIVAMTFIAGMLLQGPVKAQNVFPPTGKVGIGTATPGASLSIVAPGASELLGSARSSTLSTSAGNLGTNVGDELPLATLGFSDAGNSTSLGIRALRHAAGG